MQSPWILFFFCLLLAGPTFAGHGELHVLVRSAESGVELENVLVELPGPGRRAWSDALGRCRFGDLETGRHTARLSHLAYRSRELSLDIEDAGVTRIEVSLEPRRLELEALVVEGRAQALQEVEGEGNLLLLRGESLRALGADPGKALEGLPGLSLDRQGGRQYLRVDGSRPEQVLVLLDGLPLNPGAGGAVDLSMLDLSRVESVEYRRGADPASGAIAASINFVTHQRGGRGLRFRVDAADPWRWGLGAGLEHELARGFLRLDLSRKGSPGDYEYGNPADGRIARRRNNDRSQSGFDLDWRREERRGLSRIRLSRSLAREGIGDRLALADEFPVRQEQRETRFGLDLGAAEHRGLRLDLRRRTLEQEDAFYGRRGETLDHLEGSGTWTADSLGAHHLRLRYDLRLQLHEARERSGSSKVRSLEQRPSLAWRSDMLPLLRSRLALAWQERSREGQREGHGLAGLDLENRQGRPLLARLSLARSLRMPTFLESFPVGGTRIVGNSDLRPERYREARLLLRWSPASRGGPGARLGWIEAEALERRGEDQIVWRQTTARAWKAFNLGSARIRQLRVSLRAEAGPEWSLQAEARRLDPRNTTPGVNEGRFLPHRALWGWNLVLRRDWGRRRAARRHAARWHATLSARGEGKRHHNESNTSGLDLAGLEPWSTLDLDLGARWRQGPWDLRGGLLVGNLLDESYRLVPRVPLPGRRIGLHLSLEYRPGP